MDGTGLLFLIIVAILVLMAMGLILSRLYRRAEKDRAYVRTGMGGQKVILDGGSLFWIIKGQLSCRQAILDLRSRRDEDGISRCDIVLAPSVVPVDPRPRGPFPARNLAENCALWLRRPCIRTWRPPGSGSRPPA